MIRFILRNPFFSKDLTLSFFIIIINRATQDLFDNIEQGNFPEWDMYVQIMNPSDMERFDFDPLDPTKTWPEDIYPLQLWGV